MDPEAVANHHFWPLIMWPLAAPRRVRTEDGQRRWQPKVRPIALAAHMDAQIQRYYAQGIRRMLEDAYQAPFGDSVLAYRRFWPRRCNIHFALNAFDDIRERGDCDVLALDVEGFFDALDHGVLKRAWCDLLGRDRLPDDHFAVYQSVTRDYAVTTTDLRRVLGPVRRRAGRDNARICTPAEFREKVRPLLRRRFVLAAELKGAEYDEEVPKGIAQGTPISAILANLYMLAADKRIFERLQAIGGSYRRYSDDILVVAPPGSAQRVEAIVSDELDSVGLTLKHSKTQRAAVRQSCGGLSISKIDEQGTAIAPGQVDYLGLSFDGASIRLRASTISRFRMRMRRGVKCAFTTAARKKQRVRKRKLFAVYTSYGPGKAYANPKDAPGGFHRYLQRAAKITGSREIRKQAGQLDSALHGLLKAAGERS